MPTYTGSKMDSIGPTGTLTVGERVWIPSLAARRAADGTAVGVRDTDIGCSNQRWSDERVVVPGGGGGGAGLAGASGRTGVRVATGRVRYVGQVQAHRGHAGGGRGVGGFVVRYQGDQGGADEHPQRIPA